LLIGGVLKGKAMIENAKTKRVKSDVDGIVSAVYNYQDRFNYLPGDDRNDRTADLGATGCTGGNGDGLFNQTLEYACAWQELVGAGFISGDKADHSETTTTKRNPFGGRYLFRYTNNYNGKAGNYIYVENIPTNIIQSLDAKYDDGVYNTGDLQSQTDYSVNTAANSDIYWFAF
jgi:hypothetical protein